MKPIEIFFSYAHEDKVLMDEVRRQLIIFDRQKIIRKWHDREILPGQEWNREIHTKLKRARIILLFVSPHFIESKYCYEVEMTEALRLHNAGEAVVIPIILRPCLWKYSPFSHLDPLPEGSRALTQWQDRDEASLNVAEGIMRVVHKMLSDDSKKPKVRPKRKAV